MTDLTLNSSITGGGPVQPASRPNLDKGFNPLTMILFFGILAAGLLFVAYSIYADVDATGTRITTYLPYILLFVALLIALGFEFVNGFHDTANAVATVIYTHSLPAEFAVVWSGFFNFLGVLLSSGAVAFGIVSLLPVELILQVGSQRRLCHGVRAADRRDHLESRHLVSRPAGLELAHADRLDHRRRRRQRADARPRRHLRRRLGARPPRSAMRCCCRRWSASCCAAVLLLAAQAGRRAIRRSTASPKGNKPPPLWIRGLLILTCTGVSFAHGSNDGQKGMGLIMLILIGTVPTAYALNRALPESQIAAVPADLGRRRAR